MKDGREGESLWMQWFGYSYDSQHDNGIVYYTIEHVDLENEVVRRALASALQRDGICDSLSDSYELLSDRNSILKRSWAGPVDGDSELTCCDPSGETDLGDQVDEVLAVTFVEMPYHAGLSY